MTDWRTANVPTRNLTIYEDEDVDIGGRFRVRGGGDWDPPDGTEVYFMSGDDSYPCVLAGAQFSLHMESDDCAALQDGDSWWMYVKTPETLNGRPKVITKGQVNRHVRR